MKRGAVQKKRARAVMVWFPIPLLAGVDSAVQIVDTDRSKFIRQAVREKVNRELSGGGK
jgi:metal-responsive CopG/Arc/MetJ family transcriptional regulator